MTLATSRNMTILGILTIVGGVANAATSYLKTGTFDANVLLVTISAGIGMILGKGAQSTGGTVDNAGRSLLAPKPPGGYIRLGMVAVLALVLGVLLSVPLFARASDPLVHCFSGCERNAATLPRALGAGNQQISSTTWIGPDLGANLVVRDSRDNSWQSSFTPQFGYAFHWTPPAWTLTKSLISIGLYLSAGTVSPTSITDGRTFDLSLLPVLTIADNIGVGYGPNFHFATKSGGKDGVSGIFGLSYSTSFGGP
jgi:hypothetical protein